ncbi:MAG TPA: CcmD family protein [Candidatus Binatia bacterium]|jgi:CcmD family protein
MGKWGFVLLAYGIVWSAILAYLFHLKSRIRKAEAKLTQVKSKGSGVKHAS